MTLCHLFFYQLKLLIELYVLILVEGHEAVDAVLSVATVEVPAAEN